MNIETLCKLASHPSQYIRALVATKPKTPSEILDQLGCDKSYIVRCWVAQNRNTSLKTLYKIFNNESKLSHIHSCISNHPRANEDLILQCRAKILTYELKK
jgi:hypothetical protein